jgi:hypothetical protein
MPPIKIGQIIRADELLFPLLDDVEESFRLLDIQDTQFNRRTYVRTIFALFEGWSFYIRQTLIREIFKSGLKSNDPMLIQRLSLLMDNSATLTDVGNIKLISQRIPFIKQFAFTLRSYAELVNLNPDYFVNNGWVNFRNAVSIRNRITHPRTQNDLKITQHDLDVLQEAREWFLDVFPKSTSKKKKKL